MAASTGARKTVSIHDYPEHLNPFREDDNHNKIRFWTLGRRLSRSNSINFSGIKDLKSSWAFRSFMRKGKKGQESSSQDKKQSHQVNGQSTSPILYRRAMQYSTASTMAGQRNTMGSPEQDRYVYGGSVTPLPRSRFQERLRSSSQNEVSSLSITPRMARSEISGSRLSVESTNPFEESLVPPVPPVRASRRKKKRAPLPPPTGTPDISVSSDTSELHITEHDERTETNTDGDADVEDMKLNIELKIIEDEDDEGKSREVTETTSVTVPSKEIIEVTIEPRQDTEDKKSEESQRKITEPENDIVNEPQNKDSDEDILNSVSFRKIDIIKYRRNSSVNDDDIRLRRGNLEDFQPLSNKRSKSLNNTSDTNYVTYDINLNENDMNLTDNNTIKDKNGNQEPQKVVCKLYNEPSRKHSIETISSTEKEFLEIEKVGREVQRVISNLNAALVNEDFSVTGARVSVSDIKRKFDMTDVSSPNPIPKPRRSHVSDSGSPVNANGNVPN